MTISILGIDIGKNSCSVVGVDDKGAVTTRRTMRRQTLIDFFSKMPTSFIAMEAYCGAHHLGRLFVSQGSRCYRIVHWIRLEHGLRGISRYRSSPAIGEEAIRSRFNRLKKLSATALSWQLPHRLIE